MRYMIEKILRALLACVVFVVFSIVLNLFVNWLYETSLILFAIVAILLLFILGWIFTNE